MSGTRILCLGAGEGWHAKQLRAASADLGCRLALASYESLRGSVSDHGMRLECEGGAITDFDVVLTRTMPAGSLEQITFRLATLHALTTQSPALSPQELGRGVPLVNPPRGLEIAIDKFATLGFVARLGYAVPDTIVAQSRGEALDAFRALGGDCVVKPIFGGEGRGVMRISDPELAWYTFSTLENLDAICYVQRFVPPGGRDVRFLVIGDEVIGVRRMNTRDFRTNVAGGGHCEAIRVGESERIMALRICRAIGLKFASVDLIDDDESSPRVVEVNGIPGWKGAQQVVHESIANRLVRLLIREASPIIGAVG